MFEASVVNFKGAFKIGNFKSVISQILVLIDSNACVISGVQERDLEFCAIASYSGLRVNAAFGKNRW